MAVDEFHRLYQPHLRRSLKRSDDSGFHLRSGFDAPRFHHQRAPLRYREPSYVTALGKLAAPSTDSRELLLYPMDEVNSYAK